MEYPIMAIWQKNIVRLHANQPESQTDYYYTCSTCIATEIWAFKMHIVCIMFNYVT